MGYRGGGGISPTQGLGLGLGDGKDFRAEPVSTPRPQSPYRRPRPIYELSVSISVLRPSLRIARLKARLARRPFSFTCERLSRRFEPLNIFAVESLPDIPAIRCPPLCIPERRVDLRFVVDLPQNAVPTCGRGPVPSAWDARRSARSCSTTEWRGLLSSSRLPRGALGDRRVCGVPEV